LYAKLFTSITESSLWSEPKEVRLLFVTMLAKADQDGFVEASIPGLARVANLTIEETESSLRVLMSPDPYSKNPANEGRRIAELPGGFLLLNYDDYRSRRSAEERREYMRQYMQEYRTKTEGRKQSVNKRKQSVSSVNLSKPPLAHTEAETDTKAEAKKRSSCAEVGKQPTAPAFDPNACRFPVFPCSGEPKAWQATEQQLADWSEAYPAVDIQAAHRKAHAWIMANITKRKTAAGYAKYLNTWFAKDQDSGKSQKQAEPAMPHMAAALTADEIAEYNRTGDAERFLR
jgi:hypothetical protein